MKDFSNTQKKVLTCVGLQIKKKIPNKRIMHIDIDNIDVI